MALGPFLEEIMNIYTHLPAGILSNLTLLLFLFFLQGNKQIKELKKEKHKVFLAPDNSALVIKW